MGKLRGKVLKGLPGAEHALGRMYVHDMIGVLRVQNFHKRHIHRFGMAPGGGFRQRDGGRPGQILPKPFHTPGDLLLLQWFDQIISGLYVKALHGVIPFAGGKNDRQIRLQFPDLPRRLYPVHPAQKNIQQQPVTGFRAVVRQKILAAGIEGEVHAFLMAGAVLTDQVRQFPLICFQILNDNQMHLPTSFLHSGACQPLFCTIRVAPKRFE